MKLFLDEWNKWNIKQHAQYLRLIKIMEIVTIRLRLKCHAYKKLCKTIIIN